MVDTRVANPDVMPAQPRAAGIAVEPNPQVNPHGPFARHHDSEGNPNERWEWAALEPPIGREPSPGIPQLPWEPVAQTHPSQAGQLWLSRWLVHGSLPGTTSITWWSSSPHLPRLPPGPRL